MAETIHICRLDHVAHGPMIIVAMWMSALSCLAGGPDQRGSPLTRDSGLAVLALRLLCLRGLGNAPWLLWPPLCEEIATLPASGYGQDVLQLSRLTED